MLKKDLEKKLKQKIGFEKVFSKVLMDFMDIRSKDIDKKISRSLKLTGQFFSADRCYVFEFSNDLEKMDNTYEWCNTGIEPQKEMFQKLDSKIFPWWMEKLKKSEIIYIPSVEDMPDEAGAERKIRYHSEIIYYLIHTCIYWQLMAALEMTDSFTLPPSILTSIT